jgi:hypothetical protein
MHIWHRFRNASRQTQPLLVDVESLQLPSATSEEILPRHLDNGEPDEDHPTGISIDLSGRKPELRTLIRWVLLVLAGIPFQTAKLIGMQGIPWTKAFAVLFCASIIIGELQYLSAATTFRRRQRSRFEYQESDLLSTPRHRNWDYLALGLAKLSIACHSYLVLDTVYQVLWARLPWWSYISLSVPGFSCISTAGSIFHWSGGHPVGDIGLLYLFGAVLAIFFRGFASYFFVPDLDSIGPRFVLFGLAVPI